MSGLNRASDASAVRILVADDDLSVRTMIEDILQMEGWEVVAAEDGRSALDLLVGERFDLAILDLKMPYLSGLHVLQEARRRGVRTEVLILTAHGTIEGAVEAMKNGARDFLTKPFRIGPLVSAVYKVIGRREAASQTLAEQVDTFLRDHASEPGLKLEELSRYFKISTRYVSRLLKAHTGMPFQRRLAYYRVEMAKRILEAEDAPLYEVASRCGFGDYRRLTDTFRRLEGVSPKRYCKMRSDS